MAMLRKLRTRLGLRKERPRDPDVLYVALPGGRRQRLHKSWYRGETTNFHPVKASLKEPDAIERYVGHGWFPPAPFVTREHYITAFGSCFARHVTEFLYKEGYRVFGRELDLDAHIVRSGDGIVNTAALLQQFEWAFHGWTPANPLWHDADGHAGSADEQMQATTREIFTSTDVFIFTLGLSEVWYDKPTNEVFWRAIPESQFDPERHGFRLMGAEENARNLKRVYEIIRTHRPEARIIVTLSPVPLAATFRPISCITANCVSKASLRVAIDELMREYSDDARLHYFPSYEIVTAFLPDPMRDDLRHPTSETIDLIMKAFQRNFLVQ